MSNVTGALYLYPSLLPSTLPVVYRVITIVVTILRGRTADYLSIGATIFTFCIASLSNTNSLSESDRGTTHMADRDASPTRVPARAAKKKPTHASPPPKVNLSVQDRRHKTRLLNETQRRKDQLLGLTTYDVATHLHRYTVEPSVMMDESREGCTMAAASKSTQIAAGEVPGATTHSSTLNGAAAVPSSRLAGAAAMVEGDANTRWHTQYAQHLQHKKTTTEHPPSVSAAASSPFLRLRDTAGGGANSDDDEGETDGETLPLPPSTFEEWMAAGCPTGSWAALLEEEVYAPVAAERALLAAKYDPKGRGPAPAP